ncbi:MAG: hypothetical protein AB7S38_42870 [Vulcanimicrobiota bacterium]
MVATEPPQAVVPLPVVAAGAVVAAEVAAAALLLSHLEHPFAGRVVFTEVETTFL